MMMGEEYLLPNIYPAGATPPLHPFKGIVLRDLDASGNNCSDEIPILRKTLKEAHFLGYKA